MRALVAFFALTFAVSWTCFIGASAMTGWSGAGVGNNPVFLLGVFAPSLVALALSTWSSERAGARALLDGVLRAPRAVRWYVFALGYTAVVKLAAAGVHRVALGAWPPFGTERPVVMLLATLISTPVQAGEEIGWRGYALPRLAARVGLGPASVLLGVLWASWHLPLFFVPGGDTYHQSFPVYLLSVTALSVVLAWLYWRTDASLLMTMLLHAAINNTKDIVPSVARDGATPLLLGSSSIAVITAALLWLSAAYFLVRMRGAVLASSPELRTGAIARTT